MAAERSTILVFRQSPPRPLNVIKITRHNYHPISVFIKNKDRVILFCGTMDFLSNTMKQMFSSASKSCILYLMLSYSV